MAIFSLNHSFIGRTTDPKGSASLFVRYMARSEACTEMVGERLPLDRGELMRWLDGQEGRDRRNARVIDKVVVALPIELTHEENAELLQRFGERMTQGRASWAAAIHDGSKDADNPHAHILFRDRDWETGKRVMLTTEKGSTQRFRDVWEEEVNHALERAGFEERVDKRSLRDQGIDREPQIHVGAGSKRLHEKEYEFRSQERETSRLIDGIPTKVTVNYPVIDEGKTRWQENEERKARNAELERAMLGIVEAEQRLQKLYARAAESGTLPEEASDLLGSIVAAHIRERRRDERRRDKEPENREPLFEGKDPKERGPRRGPTDLIAGAGLALIGKIADSVESIFDGPKRDPEEQEQAMKEKGPVQQVHLDEQRQRMTEAEREKYRQQELQAYLDQRDRERHHDRGR
jgi:MobA/MobL family protein